MDTPYDAPAGAAIIVGAGIGGLTAALALRAAGWTVTVLERAADPSTAQIGSGLTIWSNAVRVLRDLGLGADLAAIGVELEHFENRLTNGRRLSDWPVGDWGRALECPSVNVSRQELHEVLLARVGVDQVTWGAAVGGFTDDGDGVRVRLPDGTERRGDILVGAEGLYSVIRAELLADGPPDYAGYAVWRAIVADPDPSAPDGTFVQTWGRGRRFGWYRLSGGRVYWFAVANTPQSRDRTAGLDARSEAQALFAGWPAPATTLLAATPPEAVTRVNTYDRPPAAEWGRGRVTLLGDAAHPMTFNIGQGACQAIEDAAALARVLRGPHPDVANALRAYEAERGERTAPLIRRARIIGAIGRWHHPVACAVRGRLLGAVLSGPAARQAQAMTSYRAEAIPAAATPVDATPALEPATSAR